MKFESLLPSLKLGRFKTAEGCLPAQHTMGIFLKKYVAIKIHTLLSSSIKRFSRVVVIGCYDRDLEISSKEKNDKLFNYKRPTAVIKGKTLYLCCFPGNDYIRHYAKLIATHFKIIGVDRPVVYRLTNYGYTVRTLQQTNINKLPKADVIIFGNVDRIGIFEDQVFSGDGDFKWKIGKIKQSDVLLLGCEFSIWGDIGYALFKSLFKTEIKKFIYVGKLGTLDRDKVPNTFIGTGSSSYLNGKCIVWKNIFENINQNHNSVIEGVHITCPSVVDETRDYIRKNSILGIFIDPEIGHMAKACNESKIQFSYLHIISDNVAKLHKQNLSNERRIAIIKKRKLLFRKIGKIIIETINQ
ncbi:MAG: hypothetical protein AAB386_01570 [Patescibacteria group bacterium]